MAIDELQDTAPDGLDSLRSNVDEAALLALFPKLTSGTLSMLFTDIVGSTKLKRGTPGAEATYFSEIKPRHDQLLKEEIERAGGHILNVIGDSFFAGFQSAKNAVNCAKSIQDRLTDSPIATPTGPLRIRIGVHSGEPTIYRNVLQRLDLCGADVDLAARLMSHADGGQVFVSEQVAALARAIDGLRFHSHGVHVLHGVGHQEVIELLWVDRSPKRPQGGSHEPAPLVQSEFVGRQVELLNVRNAIAKNRLVTLAGTGGLGKTRLARELFLQSNDQSFASAGVAFASLDQITTDSQEAVQDVMVAALRVDVSSSVSTLAALTEEFAGGSTLLILDNCETAPHSVAAIVQALLTACPHLRVLATSQRALGLLDVEAVISLAPMTVPSEGTSSIGELESLDCYRLFRAAARRAEADWEPPPDAVRTMVRILQLTDGIPLAIELVAAAVPYSSLKEIAADLEATPLGAVTDGDAIGALPVGRAERHQSLARCFQWAVDHLMPQERVAFAKLGVFAETFTEASAAGVCELTDPRIILSRLVRAGLVQRRTDLEPSRYFLLGMARAFARMKAREVGLTEELDSKYVQFFHRAVKPDTQLARTDELLSWEHDWPELIAASQKAGKIGDLSVIWRISRALSPYLRRSGLWAEREHLNRASVAAADASRRLGVLVPALLDLAAILETRGRWREAAAVLRRCVDVPQQDRQRLASFQALALQRLGPILVKLGHHSEAELMLRELQAVTPRLESPSARAQSLDQEALLLQAQQRWPEAEQKFRESLRIRETQQDLRGLAYGHSNLGVHLAYRGEWEAAQIELYRSLREWARLGNRRQQSVVLGQIGALLRRQGRFAEARQSLHESLQLRGHDPKARAATLINLGKIARLQGNWREAEETLRHGLQLATSLSSTQLICFAYKELGTLFAVQRKWHDAEVALEQSATHLSRDEGDARELASTLERLARVHLRCGAPEKAKVVFEESIAAAKRARQFDQAAATRMELALASATQGDKNAAVRGLDEAIGMLGSQGDRRLLVEAKSLRDRLGRQMTPGVAWVQWVDAAYHDQLIRIRKRFMPGVNEHTSIEDVDGYKILIREFTDAGEMMEAAIAMNELGSACRRLPSPDFIQSEAAIRSALALFTELEIPIGQADSWHKLGQLYFAKQDLAQAERAYEQSLQLKRSMLNDLSEAITLDHLADLYVALQRFDEAERSLERSFALIRSFGSRRQKWFPLRHLAELKEKRGDLQGAKQWAQIAVKELGSDSKVGREAHQLLTRLETLTR